MPRDRKLDYVELYGAEVRRDEALLWRHLRLVLRRLWLAIVCQGFADAGLRRFGEHPRRRTGATAADRLRASIANGRRGRTVEDAGGDDTLRPIYAFPGESQRFHFR